MAVTEKSQAPRADRPWMFGRAGLDPVLLPWTWAEQRLVEARNYWIGTTRPDGRPHARPVWGVWLDGAFSFSTGSLAATNLAYEPHITVHLESGSETVILEGTARTIDRVEDLSRIIPLYNQKYLWDASVDSVEGWYMVNPDVAFGWVSDDSGRDHGAAFHGTTTRWRFAN